MEIQTQKYSQTELEKKLEGVRDILDKSNYEIWGDFFYKKELNYTGFQQLDSEHLQYLTEKIVKLDLDQETRSLDMGCGNGGFALMAAAAGYSSFGIDASQYLIDKTRKNLSLAVESDLIDSLTVCKFAVGNMYPEDYIKKYNEFTEGLGDCYKETIPRDIKGEPYNELGINISDFGIIYCFPWSEQRKFLTDFLVSEARDNAILILPHRPTETFFNYKNKPSVELRELERSIWKKIIK